MGPLVSHRSLRKKSLIISPKAKELQSFGKLLFVTNEQPKVSALNKVLSYKSLTGVAEEWETTSHVYKAATAFYGAGAKDFMVTIAPATKTSAVLTGGDATLAEIQAVTAGGFTINVDGAAQVITGLNFSKVASMTAAANLLKAKLTGVDVTVGPSGLVLTTVMKGKGASISFATPPTLAVEATRVRKKNIQQKFELFLDTIF